MTADVAAPDAERALVGSVRRTTIVTRDLAASLRFWRDGLGYAVWYDGHMRTWPVPGYGYRPNSRVRIVVLAPPQQTTAPADDTTSGMIGLLSLLDEQPAGVPPAPNGLLRAGEVVVLLNTRSIAAVHDRLLALGYAPTVPTPLQVPDRPEVWEMLVRDPDGVAVAVAQQGGGRPAQQPVAAGEPE